MEKIEASTLLERIISKGGLMGRAAKVYAGDQEKADQFIRECAEQCHNKLAQDMWGGDLVMAIKEYSAKAFEKTLAYVER
ncbi:MAG: hypothetical protein H0W84_09375 [Bacteroidetes bacterium]|nr:hypothetical protein [Bacteroidota bacterium]